jgi:hypothetical protein
MLGDLSASNLLLQSARVRYLFLGFFSIHLSDFLFAPIALQEMAFAVWLIVKARALYTHNHIIH